MHKHLRSEVREFPIGQMGAIHFPGHDYLRISIRQNRAPQAVKERHSREADHTSHGRYEHDQSDRKRYALLAGGCAHLADAVIDFLAQGRMFAHGSAQIARLLPEVAQRRGPITRHEAQYFLAHGRFPAAIRPDDRNDWGLSPRHPTKMHVFMAHQLWIPHRPTTYSVAAVKSGVGAIELAITLMLEASKEEILN